MCSCFQPNNSGNFSCDWFYFRTRRRLCVLDVDMFSRGVIEVCGNALWLKKKWNFPIVRKAELTRMWQEMGLRGRVSFCRLRLFIRRRKWTDRN